MIRETSSVVTTYETDLLLHYTLQNKSSNSSSSSSSSSSRVIWTCNANRNEHAGNETTFFASQHNSQFSVKKTRN